MSPPHYYSPPSPHIFRPSAVPESATIEDDMRADLHLKLLQVLHSFTRCLLRFEYQLPHPILCSTLATDKK